MLSAERTYYRQRIAQESAAAETSSSEQARQAHRELAERYANKLELLDSISTGTPYPADSRLDGEQGRLAAADQGNLGNDVQRAPEGRRVDRPAFILGIDAEAQVDNCVADISRDQIARRKKLQNSMRLDVGEFQPSGSSVSSTARRCTKISDHGGALHKTRREGRWSLSRREPKNPCRR